MGQHIQAVHQYLTGGGRHVAGEDIERGGLARAVLAQQAEDLPGGGGEGQPVHRGDLAIALGHLLEFNHGSPSIRE